MTEKHVTGPKGFTGWRDTFFGFPFTEQRVCL
jgi:hypothetical protein